jgi:hypothetical protein
VRSLCNQHAIIGIDERGGGHQQHGLCHAKEQGSVVITKA